ncbi:DUF4279 domain-containing protein [Micromonospora sp. NPDC049051]|uniref:DUF4279 domain-containing protein n=1 Tax=unclassified Micromonospora TaxID=2617518 RepID=UPI0037245618
MWIRQYAYFSLRSRSVPASEITARLGLEPDEVLVRGSRSVEPPRPVLHNWQITCREPGLAVDEQIARVVARLLPLAAEVRHVAADLRSVDGEQGGARLQVVRHLDAEDGEPEEAVAVGGLTKLPGQHQLLGWHLDRATLAFLHLVGADLDVDEYS